MSISQNVGGMSSYLSDVRTAVGYNNFKDGLATKLNNIPVIGDKLVNQLKKTKSGIKQLVIPGMLFENMGITYLGPVDGHNIEKLVRVINEAKRPNHPVLIHVITQKGKGYAPAERHPSKFHGIAPFDIETGAVLKKKEKMTYTDVFARKLVDLAAENDKIVAITAAMPEGTGLKRFSQIFRDRFFDVGIAEEHAVTFAAGLATVGIKPVVAIYSSFLQRAYDQILHDVCIQDLPVVFAVDRAGLVGEDGETHHGIFDLSYLGNIPNMTIMAPKNRYELSSMLEFAMDFKGPIAIRYGRGEACYDYKEYNDRIIFGKSECLLIGKDIALVCVGSMLDTGMKVAKDLKNHGINATVINARFVKPIDEAMLDSLAENYDMIVTLEENVLHGGYGERVLKYITSAGYNRKIINVAVPNRFISHGNVDVLYKAVGLDVDSIVERILCER